MLTLPNCQHYSLFEALEFLNYVDKNPQKNVIRRKKK